MMPNDYDRSVYVSGTAGIFLPFAQALISGLISFFLALAGAILLHLATPGYWALGAAGVVAGLTWFISLSDWRRVVYRLESWTGADFNGDGDIGRPDPVRVEVVQENGHSEDWLELPCSQEQLITLASGLMSGATLSEAAWTGAGNIFSRAEFTQLKNELIKRGLAAHNNPKTPARGAALTAPGRAVMRRFAAMAEKPPTLQGKGVKKVR